MRSNSFSNYFLLTGAAFTLSGCVTAAPTLPPHFDHATDVPAASAPVGGGKKTVRAAQPAWQGLSEAERDQMRATLDIDVLKIESFGIIIDNQSANESMPGTTGGMALGSAVASAGYIDNALRSGRYSATTQLAAGLLGAAIGSTLDTAPTAQFHTRYTVKLGDGDIQYFDEYKNSPFRHSMGVCVSVPVIALIGQDVCTQTAESLRARYLKAPAQ